MREFTGFDRVMVYRFLDDGAKHIFAEARRADLESYLGLHYPAADISQQAQHLFVLNPIRVLPDVVAGQAALLRLPDAPEEPLDMSYTIIRAVSPITIGGLASSEWCYLAVWQDKFTRRINWVGWRQR